MAFDALVRHLASIVNAEGQANQGEAHGHHQEEDHHHMEATIERPHKLGENWIKRMGSDLMPWACLLSQSTYVKLKKEKHSCSFFNFKHFRGHTGSSGSGSLKTTPSNHN